MHFSQAHQLFHSPKSNTGRSMLLTPHSRRSEDDNGHPRDVGRRPMDVANSIEERVGAEKAGARLIVSSPRGIEGHLAMLRSGYQGNAPWVQGAVGVGIVLQHFHFYRRVAIGHGKVIVGRWLVDNDG